MTQQNDTTTTNPNQMTDPAAAAEAKQYADMEQRLQHQIDRGEISLPEQFQNDPQKFVQSYREMQRAYTQSRQAAATKETPPQSQSQSQPPADSDPSGNTSAEGTPPADTKTQSDTDWADLTSTQQEQVKSGTNLEAVWPELNKQLMSQGRITEEFAQQNGLPNEMVSMLNNSFAAKRDADRRAAAERVGGDKNLSAMLEWAKTNLPESERNQITEQLRSQNWSIALDALAHRYQQNQKVPGQINNSGSGAPSAAPWNSQAERDAAYRDPRYRVDPNYRRQVYMREHASLQQNK